MGLFDAFLGKRPRPVGTYEGKFKMISGYEPKFTKHMGGVYENELIRASINARATHISKLKVEFTGEAKKGLKNKLSRRPNSFQTWSQFLYRTSTILDVHNTVFIVPVFNSVGEVDGIFSCLPASCEIVQYNHVPYLRYTFKNRETAAIELSLCGIMTRFQYESDFFGENNNALLPTLDLISITNQGIQEATKSSAAYRFWAKITNFTKTEDLAKERKRFSAENFSRESEGGGILLFPNTYGDIHQVESKPWVINSDQMKETRERIHEYFGTNEDVVQNKAYGDSWTAFYEGAIEPWAIQFSDVLTNMLFSYREQTAGNGVIASSNRLQYLSNAEKLNVTNDLLDRGIITQNQAMEIWNLPPVEGGDVRIIRGEYYRVEDKFSKDSLDNGESEENNG